MTNEEYVNSCKMTESYDRCSIELRLSKSIRILHGALGMVTESAELADAVKKHIFYGKELDRVNIVEELGDAFWYMAILADELGVSFEEIQRINRDKLKSRYGSKFTNDSAINRDLLKERNILEDITFEVKR